jgi:hypothetical protein
MAKKAKIQPEPRLTGAQFLQNLMGVINGAPQAYGILVAAVNAMAAKLGEEPLPYLAEAAGLEKIGDDLWSPKKPAPAETKQEEGV